MYRATGATAQISATLFKPPVVTTTGAPTVQDAMAQMAAAKQQAINSGAIYNPSADTSARILPGAAPEDPGPRPVVYVADGMRYEAVPGNYTGQSPANVYCDGGNKPPCACVTQELKDYVLNNGLCKITKASTSPAIRGVGAATAYTAYSAYSDGRPPNTFKWFDKWLTDLGDFNPCDVARLPVCKTDCNAPWFEPVRLAGTYGYCKSTRVEQTPGTAYTAYTPRTPVTETPACPGGTHPSSGGCVPDAPVKGGEEQKPSSSLMTSGWWLLLLAAAAGGGYLLYRNQKKASAK